MPKPKAGATAPAAAAQARLARVEEELAGTRPWSRHVEAELAAELGVTVETIRRDRRTVLAAMRVRLAEDLEERRALMAARLEAVAEKAITAERHGAAVSAIKAVITLQGLDVPPPRAEEPDTEVEPEDTLDALALRLRDTRRLRKAAERDSSYVAAQSLLKLEAELLAQITTERRAREDAARVAATDDELVEETVAELLELPEVLLARVLAGVRAKRGA